ncbi:hypothetical protein ACFQ0H_13465 [Lysobacter gummosus]|uniref:hypothetical protein n=1 Tax=Lysobacter gummosus TaxID=262324 RepID=UPI00363B8464
MPSRAQGKVSPLRASKPNDSATMNADWLRTWRRPISASRSSGSNLGSSLNNRGRRRRRSNAWRRRSSRPARSPLRARAWALRLAPWPRRWRSRSNPMRRSKTR